MKYVEPKITNVLKADSTIQSQEKGDHSVDIGLKPTASNPGYKSDE